MLTRTRRRALFALVPLAVAPLLVAATHGSKKLMTVLSCGQAITASTTLSADVGPCAADGVIINADHVTLNLNGHHIFGTGTFGVESSNVGVVVENGTVDGFGAGVTLHGDSSRVMNMHIGAASALGINVTGKNEVISGNRVFGSDGQGIQDSGVGSQYTNNILQSNSFNGLVTSDPAVISGNKALNNGNDGVSINRTIAGASLTVTNNVANGNHLDGIAVAGGGDPTLVTMTGNKAYFNGQIGIGGQPGVIDGGNNKADENGNSTQCVNVVCS
jgi:hypothetical protein